MGLALDGTWGRGRGTLTGIALAAARRRWRVPRPDRAHPGRRARPRRLAGGGGAPQGAARRQGTDARAGIARIRSERADERHRAGRIPRAARPADLRPFRPRAAVPRQGAARPGRGQRAADPGRLGRGGVPRSRSSAGPARPSTSPPRWTPTWKSAARPGCCTRSSCRWSRVLAEMERIGIAADTDHFAEMSATLYGEVKRAEQAAYAVVGARVQPRLAQAAPGGAVQRARPAEDQADQDRLHDRLRGADHAAGSPRPEATRCSSTCCTTATSPS